MDSAIQLLNNWGLVFRGQLDNSSYRFILQKKKWEEKFGV